MFIRFYTFKLLIKLSIRRIQMPKLDLHYIDELIAVRQKQHGGQRGAPPLVGGYRVGTSINRSCIVMLSALLQAYVEEVFQESSTVTFPRLRENDQFEKYWKQMKNWGNPSHENIKHLFLKIGIPDVFEDLTWQGMQTEKIREKLDSLNRIRNQISHGSRNLTLNNNPYSLSLNRVIQYRNFSDNFGKRFSAHVKLFLD